MDFLKCLCAFAWSWEKSHDSVYWSLRYAFRTCRAKRTSGAEALIGQSFTAEAVPFVKSLFPIWLKTLTTRIHAARLNGLRRLFHSLFSPWDRVPS